MYDLTHHMAINPRHLLQPLRIPSGWIVGFNEFFDVEPVFEKYLDDQSWDFSEDLLQLSNEYRKIIIDLGWYPSHDPAGQFRLMAVKWFAEDEEPEVDPWRQPLKEFETRSKREVVQKIEEWLEEIGKHGIK